jgi:hypothetical protein
MPLADPGPRVAVTMRRVVWPQAWRVIASRFPPINLFERVSTNPRVWDVLIELEHQTNPRARDEVGAIHLVSPERRVSGPNASWVMAPFTHVNGLGSRFSDGSYGVYYAARHLETAIRETAHHFARYASHANDSPRRETMRVLVGSIDRSFDDVYALDDTTKAAILNKDSYAQSQPFGADRRSRGSDGLIYPSVRHESGQCVAAFWPDVVGIPIQERHLNYDYDGRRVIRYFDYQRETWIPIT